MRAWGGVEGGAFAPEVAEEHLEYGREAPAPDEVRGDHQRTAANGMFGGGCEELQVGEEAEITDRPEDQPEEWSAHCG